MKKDTGELHQLVSSLSLSEKRYCTLYLKKNGTSADNRYLKLFNYLKKQDKYDGTFIIRQLHYEKKAHHYAVLKKQLYEQLLNAIFLFELSTDPRLQMTREISQCRSLLAKSLYVQCEKRIARLWKNAVQMDDSFAKLQLHNLKLDVIIKQRYRNVTGRDLENWKEKALEILGEIAAETRYNYLGTSVTRLQDQVGFTSSELKAELKKIMQLPELKDERNAFTFRTKINYYQIQGFYHFISRDIEGAVEYSKKSLLHFESSGSIAYYSNKYILALNNYLMSCLDMKKFDEVAAGLVKLRNLGKIPSLKKYHKGNFDATVFWMGYILEMSYLDDLALQHERYLKVKDIKKGLAKYGDKIPKAMIISLQLAMAATCFANAKYDEAIGHIRPMMQEKENTANYEMQLNARLIHLICNYERGNHLLIDSLAKSLQRLLRNEDESCDTERAVISFIQSCSGKKISREQWSAFEKKLRKLASIAPVPQYKRDYIVWAAAHARQIDFATACKDEIE